MELWETSGIGRKERHYMKLNAECIIYRSAGYSSKRIFLNLLPFVSIEIIYISLFMFSKP